MGSFAWRRRKTLHFGEQWVPFAELNLRSVSGRWQAFSVLVDSGAVISVLSPSAAELLGVEPGKGETIELAGIDAPARRYFVHRFTARIGEMPEFTMRVAVADHEEVPNLLGRVDVLERFQIDLDPSCEETRITAPWLDPANRRIWRHILEVEATIQRAWSDHPLPGRLDEAALRFVNRVDQLVAAGAGLLKLHRAFELPSIIRSLFDLTVQFEYLMRDPQPRAALYLEFEHVTKYRLEQAWLKLPGQIGRDLRASEDRTEGEKRNREAYDRVQSQYVVKQGKKRLRMHWYPGSLRSLAEIVERTAEYDAVYGMHSAWAHGDPWTSRLLRIRHSGLVDLFTYLSRLLIQVADAKKIILTGDTYKSLVVLAEGLTKE